MSSEEVEGQYKIQISGKVHGDLVVVRGDSGEDLSDTLMGLAEHADDIVSRWGDFKTVAVAKGVFTGDAVGGGKPAGRASAPAETNSSGVPTCRHGEMKDLRGKGYKNDFFCPEKDRDKQCKPVKL